MEECIARLGRMLSSSGGGGDGDDANDDDDHLDNADARGGVAVALHERLPSAQQEVAVVSIQEVANSGEDPGRATRKGISHPTAEWALARQEQSLRLGSDDRELVVVRRWLRACRWWSLNRSSASLLAEDGGDAPAAAAAAVVLRDAAAWEVAGYRVARRALPRLVPRVLYSSADPPAPPPALRDAPEEGQEHRWSCPWAVLEYVPDEHRRRGGVSPWVASMVQVRREYGFEEPHPRWGRVPADRSLDYALEVLKQVVIPLHRHCRRLQHQQRQATRALLLGAASGAGRVRHEQSTGLHV
jgi:hypothetical protein